MKVLVEETVLKGVDNVEESKAEDDKEATAASTSTPWANWKTLEAAGLSAVSLELVFDLVAFSSFLFMTRVAGWEAHIESKLRISSAGKQEMKNVKVNLGPRRLFWGRSPSLQGNLFGVVSG